jgi:hypothetical protein
MGRMGRMDETDRTDETGRTDRTDETDGDVSWWSVIPSAARNLLRPVPELG